MDLKRQRSEGNDGILVDEEIYSDSDFYQQLLREFLNVDAPGLLYHFASFGDISKLLIFP